MNTNTIEQKLLDKELKSIQSEISRGIKIINAALAELPYSNDSTANKEEQRWILEMFTSNRTYKTGTYKHMINGPVATEFPPSMKERILKASVDKFLAELEEIKEITNSLEV